MYRGVARILVWGGGINFRDLVSIAVISLSRHDIPPPVLCVRTKDLISNGDYFSDQQS